MASDEKLSHTTVENVVDSRQSPPKAIVDCSPLQPAINKNKEGKNNYNIYLHVCDVRDERRAC